MARSRRSGGPRGAMSALPALALLVQWRLAASTRGTLPPAPIVVDPDADGGSCEWPLCSKHKVTCETKKVGTCLMPEPGCDNKNAVCSLGRCNCPHFYCAIPHTKECAPQLVYEGASPSAFDQGPWLRLFISLGSPDQFPDLKQLVDHPTGLISSRCLPAVFLLFVGLVIAVVTGIDLCEDLVRCVFCRRRSRDESYTCHPDESVTDNLTLVGLEWVDTEKPDRHKNEKEPAFWPVAVLAALTLLFSLSAVLARVWNWQITSDVLISQLDRLKGNAYQLLDDAVILNYTASNLSDTFRRVANCEENPLMSHVGRLAVNSTKELADKVDQFNVQAGNTPNMIDSYEQDIRGIEGLAVYGPCIPMLVMSFIAAGMLAEVLFTRYYGSAKTAQYEDKGLAVCAGVFVLLIVVVAATCSALLSGVIGMAQLCSNIDTNIVEFLLDEAGHNKMDPTFVNITRHYLKDDVYNPLGGFADEIYTYVETVVELVNEYNQTIIQPQALTCSPLNELSVNHIQNVTVATLNTARELFNATNVYPYYQEIVHEGVCNHMPRSIGLFCFQQAVVGLIFFPLCACWTHNYLAHHVSAQRLLPQRSLGDTTDDDTDGITEDSDAGPLKLAAVAPREIAR